MVRAVDGEILPVLAPPSRHFVRVLSLSLWSRAPFDMASCNPLDPSRHLSDLSRLGRRWLWRGAHASGFSRDPGKKGKEIL